jgi:hypothetical protein
MEVGFPNIVWYAVDETWKINVSCPVQSSLTVQLHNPHPLRVFGVDDLHQPAGYLRQGTWSHTKITAGDTTYQFWYKILSDLREQQNDVATNFPKMPDGKKKEHIFNSSHPLPAIKFQHDLAQFVAKSTSSVPFYKFWGSYSCLLKSSCHTLSSAIARPFKFGASWESRPSRSRSRSPTWSSC